VPPAAIEESLKVETGRGLLMREKPGGVASKRLAGVVLGDIQVSVRAKRFQYCEHQPSQERAVQ
jgi:hypothetical protein